MSATLKFGLKLDFERLNNLILHGDGKEQITLALSDSQFSLYQTRLKRYFYIRCPKERILKEIDDAPNFRALEALAKKHYLCDACCFSDINLYGVKRILKVIVSVLYRYPRLRSVLCFIGTHHGMERLLIRLKEGDAGVLNEFSLQYICPKESAAELGEFVYKIIAPLMEESESYIATAVGAFGLFDAVLLDKNDYDGYAYIKFVSDIRRSEAEGFHPEGCGSPEAVVYHELGHLLDNMCELSKSEAFLNYYGRFSRQDILNGLSEYALTSPREFIAEAFSEYMCNPTPRPMAKGLGIILDEAYKRG